MAIDIKNNTANNTQMRTARDMQTASKSNTTAAPKSAAPVKTDSVSITSQAQQLQGAQTKMASLPEVDQKRSQKLSSLSLKDDIKLTQKS